MNQATQNFLEELKQRPEVLGVIMFGSWARGNNRPDSDVDLVIILTEGYRRTIEYRDVQAFEIIYTTLEGAFDYWENHKDDAAGLWEVAKILYDKVGDIKLLQNKVKVLLDAGKNALDNDQLRQFHFDSEDQLNYVNSILASDPTSTNLILTNKIYSLTELFFDIEQMWIPAPKQRITKIKEINPELYSLLQRFYDETTTLKEKLDIGKKIVLKLFKKIIT